MSNLNARPLLMAMLLMALSLLAACATTDPAQHGDAHHEQPATTDTTSAQDDSQAATTAEDDIEYGNFTRDQLELALLSEFGGLRGDLGRAAGGYYALAMETRDPAIVRRAVEFASVAGDPQSLLELADLWLSLDANAMEPNLILGYQFLEQGQFVRALPLLTRVLELGGQVDFTALSARTFNLENRQRDVVIERLQGLITNFPDESSLYYALAQMYDQNADDSNARHMLEIARQRFGENPRTLLIEAQLLQNAGDAEGAEALLQAGVADFPEHRLLRYSYAQTLVQNNKLGEAAVQFTELLRREPQDMETLYSLVLINLELDELTVAEAQLRDLLRAGHRQNEAHYYLAYVLEARGALEEAVFHYQQIPRQSNAFLNAQREIMRLLIALEAFEEASEWTRQMSAGENRLAPLYPTLEAEALLNAGYDDRARQVLDQALSAYPDQTDLLFARVVLNERSDQHAAAEEDLRRIIALNPDDARALNHLGYSLTVRSAPGETERFEEALQLIERAIAISPEDPAIIDSLGWAQYKLGFLEDALYNLQRAFAAFPDPEVAAHLGEVLWVMGREAEALIIWEESLADDPDNEHVNEAMQRLTGQPS